MVGFQRNDSLTHGQKFLAGCFTGMIARLVTQPIDIVKLRTQLQKSRYGRRVSMLSITKKIIQEEGVKALFHGHCIGQLHSILAVCTQFFVYELTTKEVVYSEIDEKHKSRMEFACGIFAGCCAATVALPLEVIRVRQMIVKEQYKGLLNGAKSVYNTGGILAFYEGLSASVLQYGPAVGVSFSVFRFMQPLILGMLPSCGPECDATLSAAHKPSHVVLASMVAGATAGFVSKTVTYPFDLVKRRLQIGTHKEDERYATPSTARNLVRCTRFLSCVESIVRRGGVRGLYQGWLVTVLKSQLTSVVAFTTYESTCFFIRQFNERQSNGGT
ncbi:unnamed protein product, partial [Iphiclides podalirius]